MKCIVIETSPERTNAHTVTNEDGTPHVYATISEARAELKANGYSYNRENQRYYIKGTEYRAYIIREDSEEYADAITTEAHNRAAAALISAYAEAIGDSVTADDPEAIAAHRVARACIGLTTATDDDRATVSAMVEAIADRARADAAEKANQAADAAADPEDLEEPAPLYQRYELLAYLGEPEDYDVDAIEAEATRFTADGARVWSAFGSDLAAIAERHELYSYAPAI